MRAWRPLVGRCQAKGSKNPRYKKGAPIFAKINGGWFKSSVVEDFGDVVRVTVAGDCDREVSKSDVSIR